MSDTTLRRLRSLELFADGRRSQLRKIDQLGTTVDVGAGRRLCTEGAPADEFFVLVDGVAAVWSSDGRTARLQPGAWFGEVGLMRKCVRNATVTAVSDATILVFDRREFATLCSQFPRVRARLERRVRSAE